MWLYQIPPSRLWINAVLECIPNASLSYTRISTETGCGEIFEKIIMQLCPNTVGPHCTVRTISSSQWRQHIFYQILWQNSREDLIPSGVTGGQSDPLMNRENRCKEERENGHEKKKNYNMNVENLKWKGPKCLEMSRGPFSAFHFFKPLKFVCLFGYSPLVRRSTNPKVR